MQQHRLYGAENSRVSADSERQGRDRQRKKAWILCDLPEGVPQIDNQVHDLQTVGNAKRFRRNRLFSIADLETLAKILEAYEAHPRARALRDAAPRNFVREVFRSHGRFDL